MDTTAAARQVDALMAAVACALIRNERRSTQCRAALNRYRDNYGLLTDLADPTGADSPAFFRLCLARAEVHRQQYGLLECAAPAIVPLTELPAGPLEALAFVENGALDVHLNGAAAAVADILCIGCDEPIAAGTAAFSMCRCHQVRYLSWLDVTTRLTSPLLPERVLPRMCAAGGGLVYRRRLPRQRLRHGQGGCLCLLDSILLLLLYCSSWICRTAGTRRPTATRCAVAAMAA